MLPFKLTFLSDLFEFVDADGGETDVGFRLVYTMDSLMCPP